jgi:hypothetical protein
MMKSRRLRWAGHVARMGEMRNAYRIWVGKDKTWDLTHIKEISGPLSTIGNF